MGALTVCVNGTPGTLKLVLGEDGCKGGGAGDCFFHDKHCEYVLCGSGRWVFVPDEEGAD